MRHCRKQEFNYEGFTYMMDENCNHIIKLDKKIPKTLYKYYGISKNSIDALMQGYLYATHPFHFNDVMDSSQYLLDFSNITLERYKWFWEQMINIEEYRKYEWEKVYEEDKKGGFERLRQMFYFHFTKSIGTICLTERPLNILMWGHYAGETGFLIELDIEKCIEEILEYNSDIQTHCIRPVQYVNELEKIDMFKDEFHNPDVPILYMNNVKRKEWEYEQEWRLTIYKDCMDVPFSMLIPGMKNYKGKFNRKLKYCHKNIKKIVLGMHFFNGENLTEGYSDGEIVLNYKKRDIDFIRVTHFLYKNFNDRLYMSGVEEGKTQINRYFEKIRLEKIKHNRFKIIREKM